MTSAGFTPLRAAAEIAVNPMMHWDGAAMMIQSSTLAEVYTANGTCQCKAYEYSKACWHRASARLWRNYLAAVNVREWSEKRAASKPGAYRADSAPLITPSKPVGQAYRGIRL